MAQRHGFGDLGKSIQGAREEQEAERHGAERVVPLPNVVESAGDAPPNVPTQRFPRYTAEGMLLNPEECSVSAEGFVTGKVM